MKYYCYRCGYNTTRKGDFRKHLNRKRVCKPDKNNIPIHQIRVKYGFSKKMKSKPQICKKVNLENKVVNPEYTSGEKSTKNRNTCEFCGKIFASKQGKYKHKKKHCKSKMSFDYIDIIESVENQETYTNNSKNNMNQTSETNMINELKEIIKNKDKIIDKMMNQLEKMLEKIGNNNNNTIHINLNNYGKEDISYLSNCHFEKLLNSPFTSIPKLINNIHFNNSHPENMNVRITNKKLPYAEVYKDDGWKIQDKKETIKELVNDKIDILDDKFDEIKDDMYDNKKRNYKRFQSCREKEKVIREIEKDAELEILNGSKQTNK